MKNFPGATTFLKIPSRRTTLKHYDRSSSLFFYSRTSNVILYSRKRRKKGLPQKGPSIKVTQRTERKRFLFSFFFLFLFSTSGLFVLTKVTVLPNSMSTCNITLWQCIIRFLDCQRGSRKRAWRYIYRHTQVVGLCINKSATGIFFCVTRQNCCSPLPTTTTTLSRTNGIGGMAGVLK